jgi:hypothetical protein
MRRTNMIAFVFAMLVGLFLFIADRIGEKLKANRIVAMNMLTCLSSERDKSKLIASTLSYSCQKNIDQIEHPSENDMIAYNRKWHVTIAFKQIKINNQATWICKGTPEKLFPLECR